MSGRFGRVLGAAAPLECFWGAHTFPWRTELVRRRVRGTMSQAFTGEREPS